jgi:peptidoglycan hydrolase CwlO-like protein
MRNKGMKKLFAGLLAAALVTTGTVLPQTTAQAATKSVTVKTQAQLNSALKNSKVTQIVIKTNKGVTLKIGGGTTVARSW